MDVDYNCSPSYSYESIEITSISSMQRENLKMEAVSSMESLQGWCTKFKASILIDLIYLTNAKNVVEIGVWGGKSLVPMAIALKHTEGKIYGIDPWSIEESTIGMVGVHKDWWGSVDHEGIYQELVYNLKKLRLNSFVELIRESSEDAKAIEHIDLLHIDGNHSQETSLFDVMKWAPMVRKGGIIVFDDLNWESTRKAVEWLDQNCVRLASFEEKNIWGVWVKP